MEPLPAAIFSVRSLQEPEQKGNALLEIEGLEKLAMNLISQSKDIYEANSKEHFT